ncbi:hypothetical protein R2R35_10535 [Anaerocolumna sp. AGMB13020]|uniref:hypothetical protein n=1 Tax=Anaerocolumna sp. AGMB13020 TaxID=3081750 RepID=UPI002954E826|nr:hypothetical protein [Anaerocolumna sp. AGMB13020]WOO38894.1 hypothetical protein R2R35_10535 [Anaerocolumna sp. AGMB13020]
MKKVFMYLAILHFFIGIGAIFGGTMGMIYPDNPMGITNDLLKGSPFTNYFYPSLILFAVIGLGNLLAGFTVRFHSKYQGYISGVFGGALVIWIGVQVLIMRSVHPLHIIYFILGLAVVTGAAVALYKVKLFPMNILRTVFNSRK